MNARIALLSSLFALSCQSSPREPPPTREEPSESTAKATTAASATDTKKKPSTASSPTGRPKRKVSAKPVKEVPVSPDDPLKGKFTLEDATKNLPGKGGLTAEIKTELGSLSCELFEDKAPITVANFVGLARGLRPFKDADGKWVKRPGYDGTTFHRVIKGFMIQGGDPKGTGAGEPGYVIPDEIWEDANHDRPGLLCMANRGPNTNGMQFFITDGAAPHLDNGYTIFGECGPIEVIEKLASVEVERDRAVSPTKIQKVTIKRAPSPKPGASASAPAASAPKPVEKPKPAPAPAPAPS